MDERLRAFSSITVEDMDEVGADFDALFTTNYVKKRIGDLAANTLTKEQVDEREKIFNQMTNLFDDRMVKLKTILFLC